MGPLGFILVSATAGIGYEIHSALDELSETAGARRLKREIRTLNLLIREIPDHWESIRAKADRAAASIASFQSALGGRQGALAGAVEKISAERAAMEQALLNARVDTWPQWLEGQKGDLTRKRMQQVGIGIVTLVVVVLFAVAMQAMLGRAFRTWSIPVLISTGTITAAAFYVVGWLSFERVQLLGERVYPLRAGHRELAIASIAAVAASIAIIIAGWRVGGTSGFAYGVLLVAGGGVLGMLGYFFDDAIKGLAILGQKLIALSLGFASFGAAIVTHTLGWPLLGALGGLWLILMLLAWPLQEFIIGNLARRREVTPSEPRTRKPRRAA